MPIFDIEGMVAKEINKTLDAIHHMRPFASSGNIEEWCEGDVQAAALVKDKIRSDVHILEKYYSTLVDILDGYRINRKASDPAKWEESVKAMCESVRHKDENPTEGD